MIARMDDIIASSSNKNTTIYAVLIVNSKVVVGCFLYALINIFVCAAAIEGSIKNQGNLIDCIRLRYGFSLNIENPEANYANITRVMINEKLGVCGSTGKYV